MREINKIIMEDMFKDGINIYIWVASLYIYGREKKVCTFPSTVKDGAIEKACTTLGKQTIIYGKISESNLG